MLRVKSNNFFYIQWGVKRELCRTFLHSVVQDLLLMPFFLYGELEKREIIPTNGDFDFTIKKRKNHHRTKFSRMF